MRQFSSFACFDWSGQAVEHPQGIALATLDRSETARPKLIRPAGGWSRQAAFDWIIERKRSEADILIGLDLSPAFPFLDRGAYFPGWSESPADARALWELVETLCADDSYFSPTGFLGHAEARRYFRHRDALGDRFGAAGTGRLRAVEHHQRATGQANSASCFNLVGAAQVGKSSLTGMRLLHRLKGEVAMWPFDPIPATGPVIVEIYTSMAARAAGLPRNRSKIRDRKTLVGALAALECRPPARLPNYDDHSTDAILTAAWLRKASTDPACWNPDGLTDAVRQTEGWTFGVV